jgi:GNAT superfamily N-acetyltransferase
VTWSSRPELVGGMALLQVTPPDVRTGGPRTLLAVSDLEIKQTRFGAPAAKTLVAAAQADLAARYGSGDENPVEAVEFDPPEGSFLVAFRGGEPVACGGWRTLAHFSAEGSVAEDVAEIKRMYAVPDARGTGAASAILRALEDSARGHGMNRVVLETGGLQPEAIRFYEKHGYDRIVNYGYYKDEPDCISFGRDL